MKKDLSIDASGFNVNDPLHFSLVFDKYYKGFLQLAIEITKDKDSSKDIVSNVFHKMWEKADKDFENEANIAGFLRTSITNRSIDYLRRKGRRKEASRDISEAAEIIDPLEDQHSISVSVLEMLGPQIEKLPERCKEVIRLIYFHNMSEQEVAAAMGISKHTVRNQKKMALRNLRKNMSADYRKRLLVILVIFFCTLNN